MTGSLASLSIRVVFALVVLAARRANAQCSFVPDRGCMCCTSVGLSCTGGKIGAPLTYAMRNGSFVSYLLFLGQLAPAPTYVMPVSSVCFWGCRDFELVLGSVSAFAPPTGVPTWTFAVPPAPVLVGRSIYGQGLGFLFGGAGSCWSFSYVVQTTFFC